MTEEGSSVMKVRPSCMEQVRGREYGGAWDRWACARAKAGGAAGRVQQGVQQGEVQEGFAGFGPCESPAAGELHFYSIRCTMNVKVLPRDEKEEKKLKARGEVREDLL